MTTTAAETASSAVISWSVLEYTGVMPTGIYERKPKPSCSVGECTREHVALGYCKLHYRRFKKWGDPLATAWTVVKPEETDRACNECGETKALEDFPKDKRGAAGRKRVCKSCTASYVKDWASKNNDRVRSNQRAAFVRRKYGEAGVAVLNRILAGEACEVCGEVRERMAIDHCHTTGKVRGLLCSNCNTALGLTGENVDRLRTLIKYLETHDVS
jgi:hypothetical protein